MILPDFGREERPSDEALSEMAMSHVDAIYGKLVGLLKDEDQSDEDYAESLSRIVTSCPPFMIHSLLQAGCKTLRGMRAIEQDLNDMQDQAGQ